MNKNFIIEKTLFALLILFSFTTETTAQCTITGGVILDDGTTAGQIDAGDHLQRQVRVNLFRDVDCDGSVGAGDVLIDVETTGKTGLYAFSNLVEGGAAQMVESSTIITNNNDAEETLANGLIDINSNSLDFGVTPTGNAQMVGLRFTGVGIPFGATIDYAYVQFRTSDLVVSSGATNQLIVGEATAESIPITGGLGSFTLSQRLADNPTAAAVPWNLQAAEWPLDAFVQSADISPIVQELVSITGWKTNSPVTLFMSYPDGTDGIFRALSAGSPTESFRPTLFVGWSLPETTGFNCYVIEPNADDLPPNAVFVNGSSSIPVDLSSNAFAGDVCSANNFIAYNGSTTSCYAVAERPNELRIFNRFSGRWSTIGMHGIQTMPMPEGIVEQVEAIAMDDEGTIFTVNTHVDGLAYFGTLDPLTGQFTPIGNPLGSGENAAGQVVNFTDMDALTYNPETGLFWAMQNSDILKLDPTDGSIVQDAFEAPGKDYITIQNLPQGLIDDIAIDPITGTMYGSNGAGSVGLFYLVTIDTETAEADIIAQFQTSTGIFVTDFEGIGFAEDGQLYAVTGEQSLIFKDRAFKVDKETALVEPIAIFTPNNSDMEGCACRRGTNVNDTNPEDIGTVFQGTGATVVVSACDDFIVDTEIICSSDNTQYGVLMTIQGGSVGANGYTVLNNFTGEMSLNVTGPVFVETGFTVGEGYSFTIIVADNPECVQTADATLVDCSTTAVEWLSFDGKATKEGNLISWATASENNSDYFILESAVNGSDFERIAQIQANGNTQNISTYSFVDKTNNGQTYYRLVQVDVDGVTDVSEVILVKRTSNASDAITLFPTVVETDLTIRTDNQLTDVLIRVVNIDGRLVAQYDFETLDTDLTLDLGNLAAGNYLIEVTSNNLTTSKQIVKR